MTMKSHSYVSDLSPLSLRPFCIASPQRAAADQIPSGWEASNMKPIGYSDLGGHEAFKMAIKHVGDHWYLYMGHFVASGWSIVDVTDPTNPKVVKFLPGPDAHIRGPNRSSRQSDDHGAAGSSRLWRRSE